MPTSQPQDDGKKKGRSIQVIGAGLGRTGTRSLMEALQILGYQPYHFVGPYKHLDLWVQVAAEQAAGDRTAAADQLIDAIVDDGYTAVMDNPSCDLYLDFLRRYPNAKVILTVRDTPARFEASWKTLMDVAFLTERPFSWRFPSFILWTPLFRSLKEIRPFMGSTHLQLPRGALTHGWQNQPEGYLAEIYNRHNRHVQDHVNAKQLLVFNVKEGWEPLCRFLDCDIPAEPFPHAVNDTKFMKRLKRGFTVAVYSWIPIAVSVGAGVMYYGMTRSRQSGGRVISESTTSIK